MGTNGKIFKRGRVYWFEDATGKRSSLRTRDRVEAQRLAALRAGGDRAVSAFSTPRPNPAATPSISEPQPAAVDADGVEGADFTADVGAASNADSEIGRRSGPEKNAAVSGELMPDALSAEQEALAEQIARTIVLGSSVLCAIAIRYVGGRAGEPPQAAQDALAGAWMSKTRAWVLDEKISPWTLIVGATIGLGFSQFRGMAPVEKPAPTASPETVGAGGA